MKKLKIIIPLLVIIIAIAIVAVFVLGSGKIALTDKSKVAIGLSKTLNTFETADGISSAQNLKIMDSISSKPYEADTKMTIDANIEDLESLIGDKDTASLVNDVLDQLSKTEITTKVGMDSNGKKALVNLNLKNEDLIGEISGEMAMTPEEITFRSKDLNEDYLTITKEDSEDYEELEDVFTMIEELFKTDFSTMMFTDEEIKHFKDTYGNILSDSVKNDMITSEKSEFEVNGSKEACTKATLTYNNEQFKELLNKYITTYENDKKGKEILSSKFTSVLGEDLATDFIDEFDSSIEELKSSVNEIEGTKLEFITYATAFETFGTETKLTIDEDSAVIKETFNKDNTVINISIAELDVATLTVKNSSNEFSVDAKIDIAGTGAELNFLYNKEKLNFAVSVIDNEEKLATVGFTVDYKVTSDTNKAYSQDATVKMAIDVSVDDETKIKGDIAMNISEAIKIIDEVKVPDASKAVSITDTDALSKYVTDCQDALNKYSEKLEKNELVKEIMELSNSVASITSGLDTDLDIEVPTNTENKTTEEDKEDEKIDVKDLEADIKDWYTTLEGEDDQKKSEVIEENMITDFDFMDEVTVNTYISWEEGESTDKGYLGIEVTDEDDNSYEFYIDLSSDKVYTEDTVTFDTDTVTWNEF